MNIESLLHKRNATEISINTLITQNTALFKEKPSSDCGESCPKGEDCGHGDGFYKEVII